MPYALSMGVKLDEFWHLNPHTLLLIADGYNMAFRRQIERDNLIAHIQGAYFVEALAATVGNMFSEKGSKKHEYPIKPYELNLDPSHHKSKEDKDKENDKQLKLFAAQLTAAMHNFNVKRNSDIDAD